MRPKPANGYENTFSDDAHERVPVYVDEEQLYHYQVSLLFRLFKNLIGVPKEILGISHLEAYDAVRPVRYYRLNGTSGSHPGKGLNIMLDRGGRRKKIVSTTH